MRFAISRTSAFWDETKPPCEGAQFLPYTKIKGWWNSNACHHERETLWGWFLDVDSIEDLLSLFSSLGKKDTVGQGTVGLVLKTFWDTPEFLQIEIYDSYRE